MKKITLTALAAVAMTAAALPAAAQSYGRHGDYGRHHSDRSVNINQMQNELDRRLDRGARTGRLTQQETRVLRRDFNQIARLEARYRSNGLSGWERNDLERRLAALDTSITRNLRDGQYAYRR